MNEKVLETLKFKLIRQKVADLTSSERGKSLALELTPSNDEHLVAMALADIADALLLESYEISIPQRTLADVRKATKRLLIGASLNREELASIRAVLLATQEMKNIQYKVESYELTLEHLDTYLIDLETVSDLRHLLVLAMDETGYLLDTASAKLAHLRKKIQAEENGIRAYLESIIKSPQAQKLSEPIFTIRNERFVLPVKTEYRQHFGGVVHDQSASGRTLFIEPGSVVDRNNLLNNLKQEAKQEALRIYAELSVACEPYIVEIENNSELLAQLDLIAAKMRYSREINASRPKLVGSKQNILLKGAKHPMIDPHQVVANDIIFIDAYRMIIITGPNTGGKTVTLRTMGLLQIMVQSGLFIPVEPGSQTRVFQEIFTDIGDEQSIEQNLSTFSGHMKNIITILENANEDSLILIDELGSGTDPKEGAALAMAILNYLARQLSTVIVTTHYPELKAFSFEKSFAINASMTFNSETLSPTFQLLIGEPGRSNALDIAKRLGLDAKVIEEANSYLSQQEQNLNDMLEDLTNRRKLYERKSQQLNHKLKKADKLLHDVSIAFEALKADRDSYLSKAKLEAEQLVNETEEKANGLLREIREWHLKRGQSMIKEEQLQEKKTALAKLHPKQKENSVLKKVREEQQNLTKASALKKGDEVLIPAYGQSGTLIEAREGDQWLVQLGALQMVLAASQLEKKSHKNNKKLQDKASVKASAAKSVSTTLDLRGERYEEAMRLVEQFIDSAILAKHPQVTIIHGHGTGALRKGVQTYLSRDKRVLSFGFASYNLGGQGATIVKLIDR